jgi:hypothetical protein
MTECLTDKPYMLSVVAPKLGMDLGTKGLLQTEDLESFPLGGTLQTGVSKTQSQIDNKQ